MLGPSRSTTHDTAPDLEAAMIVSNALKQVFESVDPEAFAFTACAFTQADGSAGPPYYLCNVVRVLDALDEEASRVRIKYERDHDAGEDLRFYSVSGGRQSDLQTGGCG
ncbi:imm11 family protein [Pseudomonas sp. Leaf127]|uniref:imm11 family protein n=1 Tax=Pseudomonas sp. Leaf127 TaxID=1736267 RepID=UPI003FA7DAEE